MTQLPGQSPIYDEMIEGMQVTPDETPFGLNADQLPTEDEHDTTDAHRLTGYLPGAPSNRTMIASPNHSSRGGKKVRLLIVHTAEGARTVESLGAWFASPSRQVSSHAGIDDVRIETYVPYDQAAWTCRAANSISDNVELCGFAAWTREQWLGEHANMLVLLAQWLRERAAARGIPLRKLTPAQVAAGASGVCAHVDWTIGMKDGSHTDCGTGFPWDHVMELATASAPAPVEEPPMAVERYVLPAGNAMEETLIVPVFNQTDRAELWMVTGWENAEIHAMYYVRDRGPNESPSDENWGGTGEWTLVRDDRPGFDLGQGCTSVAVMYSSPRPIHCLIRYPS